MYRGKFQSDKREGTPVYRESSPVRNTRTSVQQPSSRQTASQRTAQAQPQRSAQVQRTAQAQRTAQQREVPQAAPQRRGPRVGGIIFYTLYFLIIFVFCVGTLLATKWLQGWLVDFEAAQPTVKSQEVFEQLFGNPDWAALYKSAGIQDTPYEGVDAYVAYMQEKTAGQALTYSETSAGTSGDKKYFVKLGDEKIASFTLSGATEGSVNRKFHFTAFKSNCSCVTFNKEHLVWSFLQNFCNHVESVVFTRKKFCAVWFEFQVLNCKSDSCICDFCLDLVVFSF